MKKLFFIATLGVAGLMSANSIEKDYEDNNLSSEEDVITGGGCVTYGMYVWCTDEMYDDTVCWGEGTPYANFEDARLGCILPNSQALTLYMCPSLNPPGTPQDESIQP